MSLSSPPSSFLPTLRAISSTHPSILHDHIEHLRKIYNPPVRGTRRRRDSQRSLEEAPEDLRADRFELNYVVTWLTTLVSRHSTSDDPLISSASALLALCAGTASAGTVVRTFDFPSSAAAAGKVSVTLRDAPLDNSDYASVGAQTWGGACVLSEMIAENPKRFGLDISSGSERPRPRILELGAGTGLVSLVVTKLLLQLNLKASVVATDYYPSVLSNLVSNIASNELSELCTTHPLDWSLFPSLSTRQAPLNEPFDIIFGADVVYEPHHTQWLNTCLRILLAKPHGPCSRQLQPPAFHLLIPLRHTHIIESKSIEEVFPLLRSSSEEEDVLRIYEKETIRCETDTGEDVVYAYYRIGW